MVGDCVMRYQYLALVHFLLRGDTGPQVVDPQRLERGRMSAAADTAGGASGANNAGSGGGGGGGGGGGAFLSCVRVENRTCPLHGCSGARGAGAPPLQSSRVLLQASLWHVHVHGMCTASALQVHGTCFRMRMAHA